MEIKRVTEDFGSRGEMSLSTLYEIEDIMYMIEMLFDECDTELANAGMPTLGYEKQPIGTMRDHLVILLNYVQHAHPQCYTELDHPLYVGFKNEATQALSEIVLEDITTDNTFEMQKYEEIIDVNGQYYRSSTKKNLTMADFLGLDAVVPKEGMSVIENVETIGWFTALFQADYESMGAAAESLDQMLEMYLHGGEFSHKEYHPVGNFVLGILDVTIIKPFIESIYGKGLITREKLTDFERGMQLVNAAVGAVTFGQGALALNFAEMSGKEIATSLLKTWALEAVSDMSAYTVGYACDELGMPASVTFLASLATGCSVSVKAGKYVFQDANSNIVKELDADGMQTFLKELDVDLGDVTWGGGYKGITTSVTDVKGSTVERLTSDSVKKAIQKNGLTVDEFSKLLQPNHVLSDLELELVQKVRVDIGLPTTGTTMSKIIPQSDLYKYLNGEYDSVRGFVSVDEHSSSLKGLNSVYEGNRLDYNNTAFKTGYGVDGISQSVGAPDTVYGKITYALEDANSVKLCMEVPSVDNAPYTGTGFTGSKNIVLPEQIQSNRNFIDGDILRIYDSATGNTVREFLYDSDFGWLWKE